MAGCAAITGASPDVMLKQWRAGWTALPGCRSTAGSAGTGATAAQRGKASPTYPVLARLWADSRDREGRRGCYRHRLHRARGQGRVDGSIGRREGARRGSEGPCGGGTGCPGERRRRVTPKPDVVGMSSRQFGIAQGIRGHDMEAMARSAARAGRLHVAITTCALRGLNRVNSRGRPWRLLSSPDVVGIGSRRS